MQGQKGLRSKGWQHGNHRIAHTAQYIQVRQAHAGQRTAWAWAHGTGWCKEMAMAATEELSPTPMLMQGVEGGPRAQHQRKEEAGKDWWNGVKVGIMAVPTQK